MTSPKKGVIITGKSERSNVIMKTDSKRHFVKSFCALSIASLIVISSLVSVTAAIAGGSMSDSASARVSASTVKKVILDVDGARKTVSFTGKTVGELLLNEGVTVSEGQIVVPAAETKVTPYMVVNVRSAKPVSVTADGKTRTVMLAYGNVVDALKLAGIHLYSEDILSVERTAKIEDIKDLKIQRVTYSQKIDKEKVPFEKVTQNSDEVEPGETKPGAEGKNGEKEIVRKVKYIDGKAVSETVVSEKITKEPVDEVTLVGTKGIDSTGGVGTFVDSNGVTVAYKEVFTGSGTAYTAPSGALTATGVPAYHGGVAIDPNLIPYGSKLYVVSTDGSVVYGYCTAVDTGGFCDDGSAIIDVFYDTYDECINWGRRDVNVYVIE